MGQIMLVVDTELVGGCFLQLVGVLCTIRLSTLCAFVSGRYAKDVGNDVAHPGASTLCFQAQGDLDMWLALRIRVVLGIFTQSL